MINKELRTALKELSGITEGFILNYPQITFTDSGKQIVASLNTAKIDESLEDLPKIGISNISNFLSAVDLINNPEIDYDSETRIFSIKNDDTQIKYLSSDLKSMTEIDYKIIETTKKVTTALSFNLTKDIIDQIIKASNVFNEMDTVFIEKNNDTVTVSLGVHDNLNAVNNSFSIKIDDYESTDKDFSVKIPVESIKKIPKTDYELDVKYNEERDAYRIFLSNPILEVVLSVIK
jgi:hypothetical protein